MCPSGQFVPAEPPQSTVHCALPEHVTEHEPSHLMSQVAESEQTTVLAGPSSSLQSASVPQVACEPPPALRSHLSEPVHVMLLPSPPSPLHSEVASQVIVIGPTDEVSHFPPAVHAIAQPRASQLAWQVGPALHAHVFSTHEQPTPVHVATPLVAPPPHETAAIAITIAPITMRALRATAPRGLRLLMVPPSG